MTRTVLVAGATGKQGGAVVQALLDQPDAWHVRALTRKPESPRARALAARGVELVRGDMADPASLEPALAGAYAAFSVQDFRAAGLDGEVRQGVNVADVAKACDVRHLVYTSVGGADRNSGVPHFTTKWRIEEHIRSVGIPATILRPTSFMEGFGGPAMVRFLALGMFAGAFPPDKPVQMIATRDIGILARIALADPDRFVGQAVEIAGDELTFPQILDVIRQATGHRRVRYLRIPGALTRRMGGAGTLLSWLVEHGYQADLAECRTLHPGMLTLADWLGDQRG